MIQSWLRICKQLHFCNTLISSQCHQADWVLHCKNEFVYVCVWVLKTSEYHIQLILISFMSKSSTHLIYDIAMHIIHHCRMIWYTYLSWRGFIDQLDWLKAVECLYRGITKLSHMSLFINHYHKALSFKWIKADQSINGVILFKCSFPALSYKLRTS